MDFDKYLRKYVWDDEKTPYFTPSAQLTRRQAHYELLAYTVFLGLLFTALSMVFLVGAAGQPRSFAGALFCFSMLCTAIILAFTRHPYAALYASTAPVAAALLLLAQGMRPHWGTLDVVVIALFLAAWLRYALRVVAIARRFDDMDLR